MQNLLTYSHDTKDKGFLRCEGWSSDEADKFENLSGDGVATRKKWLENPIHLAAVPKIDIAQQHRLLPDGMNITLKFIRAENGFTLLDLPPAPTGTATADSNTGSYKIIIQEATFRVKKVVLSSDEQLRLIKEMRIRPFEIPFRRGDVTAHSIAPGVFNKTIERVFEGQLPRKIIMGLVRGDAYNGDINKSPFLFQDFNVTELQCYCNGVSVENKPYKPDFKHSNYSREYLALCDSIGSWRLDHSPGISYEDYGKGCTFYSFNVAPDTNCQFTNVSNSGNISFEIKFLEALDHSVCVIIYAEFDSVIYINESRQVSSDFQ